VSTIYTTCERRELRNAQRALEIRHGGRDCRADLRHDALANSRMQPTPAGAILTAAADAER
jgi:hypothetical protein